ncbi:GRAM domain-containing protein 2A isoform X2 [Pungitius pungitius]|nr:GRAM domain-containing protein 2A isoform X2 [Pungitius pungitius]XP_037306754.1 GRAM domain-containing protein 2A isoform X2 [Pungitius pungitius]
MMSENMEPGDDVSLLHSHEMEPPREEDGHCPLPFRLQLIDDLSYEDVKKCYRGSTVSKYNSQYHKLFQTVPKDEILMKVYSCALLRDILLQGRLYISRNWLCFYANLFGKDIKVCIPVVSVRLVKKHRTAGLVPNGLAITMDTAQKYVFVSLLSRDSVYDVLRRICTHLQVNGKSLSLKQFLEEPISLSMVNICPLPHRLSLLLLSVPSLDSCPLSWRLFKDEFPAVLKWRRKPSLPVVSSSLPDLLGSSSPGLAADAPFITHTITDSSLETETILLTEPVPELGHMEYQLLKLFILLVFFLVLSSCYLAFRVCRLEQQMSFLSSQPTLRDRCGELPCWLANQRTGT